MKTIYWDACIFYEWLGEEDVDPSKQDGIKEILAENEKGENLIVTSVITHLEVLPTKIDLKADEASESYLSLFDGVKFHEIELTTNILLRAREIRDHYYIAADDSGHGGKMMDLGDCIHLATATIHKAEEFHSRDGSSGGSKIPLLGLSETDGINRICDKYEIKILSPKADQGSLDV